MIHNETHLSASLSDELSYIGRPEELLFFDIETTGLSKYRSSLYLIGYLLYDSASGSWISGQYFCESLEDEIPVLKAFFALLHDKTTLVSYNGDRFDLPFLTHLATQYRIPCPLDSMKSIDLLRLFQPLKKLLSLEDLKLKTCEHFLDIAREDRYSGKDLIGIYEQWQKEKDPERLHLLLLHNQEDIENLPNLLPLLQYRHITDASKTLLSQNQIDSADGTPESLRFTFHTSAPLPKPLHFKDDSYRLTLEADSITLDIRLYAGELRYFYPDIENYYYLPAEDMAIHKSVASFVDAKHRRKATAKNCYQRKNGIFLPEPSPVFQPVFRTEYNAREHFTPFTGTEWSSSDAVSYLNALLSSFLTQMHVQI